MTGAPHALSPAHCSHDPLARALSGYKGGRCVLASALGLPVFVACATGASANETLLFLPREGLAASLPLFQGTEHSPDGSEHLITCASESSGNLINM